MLWEWIVAGGMTMATLIFLSVVSIGVVLERLAFFKQVRLATAALRAEITAALEKKQHDLVLERCRQSESPLAAMILALGAGLMATSVAFGWWRVRLLAVTLALLGAVFQMVSHGLISALLFLLVGIVYRKTGTRDLEVLRGLLNPEKGLPFTGSLMIVGVMASAGLPGMAGFISEFLVFRGAITTFPLATLLSMVGSGLTAVYFLLLVNRAFFGRLAITPPSGEPLVDTRLDVRLAPVAPRETIPAIALVAGVVGLGLLPSCLSRLSEVATTAMALTNGGVS